MKFDFIRSKVITLNGEFGSPDGAKNKIDICSKEVPGHAGVFEVLFYGQNVDGKTIHLGPIYLTRGLINRALDEIELT